MTTNPTLLTQPIAANGAKNVIPNTTSTAGAMSQDQGFPAETALPLGAGGVAPTREDFNGAFNLLSGIAFMAQKGWVFLFDENQDYFAGCMVRDPLDSKIYEAINDVLASSTHPSADSVNWKQSADMSAYTTTVNSPMFNKRDIITTSGTYTAPVTGWYKITIKGGGSGGNGAYYVGNGSDYQGGTGGSEGGTTIAYERMTAGDMASVVIGAGGNGGTTGVSPIGGAGGDSTVTVNGNTYTGGGANISIPSGDNYRGGTGTIYGSSGSVGGMSKMGQAIGGTGGGTGAGVHRYDMTSTDALPNSGAGGGGGEVHGSNHYNGGAGGDGFAWFEYFDSSLNP